MDVRDMDKDGRDASQQNRAVILVLGTAKVI